MKSLLKKYSEQNPEKFNRDFILSREKQDVLAYVKDIFKSLEILSEIKVEEVTLETSESELRSNQEPTSLLQINFAK